MKNKISDKELKTLLSNLCLAIDTREQEIEHITSYLDKKKIKYTSCKLLSGDYSCYIESNEDTKDIIGPRDIWFDDTISIERKNSLTELAASIKARDRFKNEFDRARIENIRMLLFVEDDEDDEELIEKGLQALISHKYKSEYDPRALYGSLKSFETKYMFTTNFVSRKLIGMEIYHTLYYAIRNILK